MEDITAANIDLSGDNLGCLASLFYADDNMVGSRDTEWLQNANQYLYNLFRDCVGLKPNTDKIDTMSYHPRVLRDRCIMECYKR